MSGSWSAGSSWLEFTAGDFAGDGAYTIAVLTATGGSTHGMFEWSDGGTPQGGFLLYAWHLFGRGDGSAGFGQLDVGGTSPGWQVYAMTKAAGSSTYRMHYWDYASDGSGSMTHGVSSGATSHADWSGADTLRVGYCESINGLGAIDVVALWDRELSDAELDTLVAATLSPWADLDPAMGVELSGWDGSTGANVFAGTSTFIGETGTVAAGAGATSFDYEIVSSLPTGSAVGTIAYTGTASGTTPDEVEVPEGEPETSYGGFTFRRRAFAFGRSRVPLIIRDELDPTVPVILTSPDGTDYQLHVSTGGVLTAVSAVDPPPDTIYHFPRPLFRTSKRLAFTNPRRVPRVISDDGTVFRIEVANGGALSAVEEFPLPLREFTHPVFDTSQREELLKEPPAPLVTASNDNIFEVVVSDGGVLSTVEFAGYVEA